MFSIRTHNILDYVAGIFLIAAPYIFGFQDLRPAFQIFEFTGFILIAYSLLTRYPYSLAKLIPLGLHMIFDLAIGVVLISSPFIGGYFDNLTTVQKTVHIVSGVAALGLVAFTRMVSSKNKMWTASGMSKPV